MLKKRETSKRKPGIGSPKFATFYSETSDDVHLQCFTFKILCDLNEH